LIVAEPVAGGSILAAVSWFVSVIESDSIVSLLSD
jgi:hypothetical protein